MIKYKSNNIVLSLKRKIETNYFPVPLDQRSRQIFLNAKILSAKITGKNPVLPKNDLSENLWELAVYFEENGKYAKAARFALKSARLLCLDTNNSELLYIERMLFISENLLKEAYKSFKLGKMERQKKYLCRAHNNLIGLKDFNLLENYKTDYLVLYYGIISGFIQRIEYYLEEYNKNKSVFVYGKLINLRKILKALKNKDLEFINFFS